MAVLDTLPGLEVTITVDGADLQEYEEPGVELEPKVVTRYIEAISDANFVITYRLGPELHFTGDCVALQTEVDGVWVYTPLVDSSSVGAEGVVRKCGGPIISTEQGFITRRLRFSLLEIVSEQSDSSAGDAQALQDLGDIKVEVYHMWKGSQVKPRGSDIPKEPQILDEKALKGKSVSHSVSFGDAESISTSTTWSSTYVDPDKDAAATIMFKYRSKAIDLQRLMIIPRTPSHVPLEDRPMEELSLEEARELLRQRADSTPVKRKIKHENEDRNSRPRKSVRHTTFLELDDDDSFREVSSSTRDTQQEREVVELE